MSESTEVQLEVGESKVRHFEKARPLSAIAELVWNSLDANATVVEVEVKRTLSDAIERIVVSDNGHGISVDQARTSFRQYGETWKYGRTHTLGNERIIHGENGEGRLYAFALGSSLEWVSVSDDQDQRRRVRVTATTNRPTLWNIQDEGEVSSDAVGTRVSIDVPQGRRIGTLELDRAIPNLTARFAFYLHAYPDVQIRYDGVVLDPSSVIQGTVDLALDEVPKEYSSDEPAPIVTFVEWNTRVQDRKLMLCDSEGVTYGEYGEEYSDSVVSFTPYLKSVHFRGLTAQDLHELPMRHSPLLHAADQAIRKHVNARRREISGQVVEELKEEGIYPYDGSAETPADIVERQTFDLVVTVARSALTGKAEQRRLSVRLIQSALERDPSNLQKILRGALNLTAAEEVQIVRLLEHTELSSIISATTTVTDRLNFIGGLRKILADKQLRSEFREVDQLHPLISRNLWLFGEEWLLTRSEIDLTTVLKSHLSVLGDEVLIETDIDQVRRPDGRTGRVDILLFRGFGDERGSERLIVELKRPTVKIGPDELSQIKSYARAIVEDPQFNGAKCKWKFILVAYNIDSKIRRDIEQRNKPKGLADDQDEYEVWVMSWAQIFDSAERKLRFFRKQLDYDASEARVTEYLQETYSDYIPESMRKESDSQ